MQGCGTNSTFTNESQKKIGFHQQKCRTYKVLRPSGVKSTSVPVLALTRISPYSFDVEGLVLSGTQPPVSFGKDMGIDPNPRNGSSSPNPLADTLGDEFRGVG